MSKIENLSSELMCEIDLLPEDEKREAVNKVFLNMIRIANQTHLGDSLERAYNNFLFHESKKVTTD